MAMIKGVGSTWILQRLSEFWLCPLLLFALGQVLSPFAPACTFAKLGLRQPSWCTSCFSCCCGNVPGKSDLKNNLAHSFWGHMLHGGGWQKECEVAVHILSVQSEKDRDERWCSSSPFLFLGLCDGATHIYGKSSLLS